MPVFDKENRNGIYFCYLKNWQLGNLYGEKVAIGTGNWVQSDAGLQLYWAETGNENGNWNLYWRLSGLKSGNWDLHWWLWDLHWRLSGLKSGNWGFTLVALTNMGRPEVPVLPAHPRALLRARPGAAGRRQPGALPGAGARGVRGGVPGAGRAPRRADTRVRGTGAPPQPPARAPPGPTPAPRPLSPTYSSTPAAVALCICLYIYIYIYKYMADLGQLAWLCSDNVHGRAWTVCVAGKQNRVLLRETSLPRGPVRRRQLPARVWNTPAPQYEYRPLHAASPSSAKRRRTSSLVRHLGWRGTNFSSFFFQRSPWVFLLLLLPCFPSVCCAARGFPVSEARCAYAPAAASLTQEGEKPLPL